MARSLLLGRFYRGVVIVLLLVGGILCAVSLSVTFAEKPDKDKTAPVISGLHTEFVTSDSAVIAWTTDEPADSDIKYGIAPAKNIHGPGDGALVLNHSIVLSELVAETTYEFCVESQDEAKNKSEGCDAFTTAFLSSVDTAPPDTGHGGGDIVHPTYAYVSGFAYPGAAISVELRPLFSGEILAKETTAGSDGSFTAEFKKFPQGFYFFTVSVKDVSGATSARKGFHFYFSPGSEPLFKDKVIIPPTLSLAREVVAWGDDILVRGSAVPNTGVLVEAGGVLYEAMSDEKGLYEVFINSARLVPGKISLRARSSLISRLGHDYSLSQTVILTASSVPKADLNADGKVNIIDLSKFLGNPVDINSDGTINSVDVSIFLRAFSNMNRSL